MPKLGRIIDISGGIEGAKKTTAPLEFLNRKGLYESDLYYSNFDESYFFGQLRFFSSAHTPTLSLPREGGKEANPPRACTFLGAGFFIV